MEVTRELIESVSDKQGLNKGQQTLMKIHLGDPPYVGKELNEQVAHFIKGCKGYRGLSAEVKNLNPTNRF